MTVSKSIGMADSECAAGEIDKITGTKSSVSEFVNRSPGSNARSGHIVYVRRKPETDSKKTDSMKSDGQCVPAQQSTEVNKSMTCAPDATLLPRASSPNSSSTRRSVSPSPGTPGNAKSAESAEPEYVHINSSNPSSEPLGKANVVASWEERYRCLQSLLKTLDQSNQQYVQMLRSLSSVELSRQAVELEKRSMKLSMEEAKEIERAGMLGMLGECGKKIVSKASSTQQDELHK
ncbi:integral membrane protein hemolysin-III homolog [Striga asiatica]|uniref:Integral membrane protein hemolysin-III homolog n=1 Tax=Striga asiatica TaxID=4170 RepID=A0A5A7QB18_STRAF|nr:integral membrane protein hemolysin-III homolog [Striga asiatica]